MLRPLLRIALAATVLVACVPSSEPLHSSGPPPLAEPYGACRVTPDCRVGVCNEGRCLPPQVFFDAAKCFGNLLRERRAFGSRGPFLYPFVDCTEWGATCIERRGCALPPGAQCAAEGKRLLPCGSGDVCVDEHCVADDVGGFVDAPHLRVGESITMTMESPDDIDCVIVDNFSTLQNNFSQTGFMVGFSGFSLITGELEGLFVCSQRPGIFGMTAMAPDFQSLCIDDHTISNEISQRTCPENTVCRPEISLNRGVSCVPALGQPCENSIRCGGYCQLDIDRCVELPSPLPQPSKCTISGNKLYYGSDLSGLKGYVCADACRDGIGCVDSTPTSRCTMWHVDPAGGLARCTGASVPAWSQDDFPGYYATAPLVSPGAHTLTSAHPGDIDCLTVVSPVRGVLVASTSSGAVTPTIQAADVGAHVSFCVEGHEGTATLQVDAVAEN